MVDFIGKIIQCIYQHHNAHSLSNVNYNIKYNIKKIYIYIYLLHIMCGYQCDKAVNKNDTYEKI